MVLKLTGTHPGGAYEVHCPANRKIYVVWNATAGDVTFKTVAGTGIPVNAGAVLILYCDGTNVIQLAGRALPAPPITFSGFRPAPRRTCVTRLVVAARSPSRRPSRS